MKNLLHHCISSKVYEEKNQYPIEVEAKEAEDVQCEALIMKQAQSDPLLSINTPLKKNSRPSMTQQAH